MAEGSSLGLGLVGLLCCVEVRAAIATVVMISSKEADLLRSLEVFLPAVPRLARPNFNLTCLCRTTGIIYG